ncbi:hypothetical protein SAMN05444487_1088 [Marininema mesophilum]|uniref:Uncharacterized protein n=1 Tax=Marininema mesophilum TaxID=1048340 RepID=A0A1H2XNT5_9BACL|nr:hypothetical protein [Marininema mesophilum]SDW94602.1 hypothetical protein SAMN05444487_1088 [Marininema mesophilum]
MAINEGWLAHLHALNALEELYHEYWDLDLAEKVRQELASSVDLLGSHVEKVPCPCGDTSEDVTFYRSLLGHAEAAVVERNLFPLPLVQEALAHHFSTMSENHRCIRRLLGWEHDWVKGMEKG